LSASTTYYVSALSAAGCSSTSRLAVVATIHTVPTVSSVTDGSYCGTGSVVLGATASVGTIKWYDALAAGNLLYTGNTYTTGSLSVSATYYAEAINNGCSSVARTAVNATIKNIPLITNSVPTVSAGASTTFCEGGSVLLSSTGAAGYALQFNGASSQYVQASASSLPTGNSSFTIEAWAKTAGTSSMSILNWGTSKSGQQSAMRIVNGHLYFDGGSNNLEGSTTINDGNWRRYCTYKQFY
jgi:hypothetical protein